MITYDYTVTLSENRHDLYINVMAGQDPLDF